MKHISFLLLFSCGFFYAAAQQKPEFGLVVKTGIHTLPYQQLETTYYNDGGKIVVINKQNAGYSNAFGLRAALPIGSHFRVSGEAIYRLAAFSTSQAYQWSSSGAKEPEQIMFQNQRVNESSILIPISIQYLFKKTSISFGIGLSRILSTEINGRQQYDSAEFEYAYSLPKLSEKMSEFKPELAITAGVFHGINPQTSIGLEFTYERRAAERRFASDFGGINGIASCFCYGFLYLETPSLRNLSISLQHNLLR